MPKITVEKENHIYRLCIRVLSLGKLTSSLMNLLARISLLNPVVGTGAGAGAGRGAGAAVGLWGSGRIAEVTLGGVGLGTDGLGGVGLGADGAGATISSHLPAIENK